MLKNIHEKNEIFVKNETPLSKGQIKLNNFDNYYMSQ